MKTACWQRSFLPSWGYSEGAHCGAGLICQRRQPGEGTRHIFVKANVFPGNDFEVYCKGDYSSMDDLDKAKESCFSCISSSADSTFPDTALRHAGSPF